jgi:hypothetical protein
MLFSKRPYDRPEGMLLTFYEGDQVEPGGELAGPPPDQRNQERRET